MFSPQKCDDSVLKLDSLGSHQRESLALTAKGQMKVIG